MNRHSGFSEPDNGLRSAARCQPIGHILLGVNGAVKLFIGDPIKGEISGLELDTATRLSAGSPG
jgi:hypothetical protein